MQTRKTTIQITQRTKYLGKTLPPKSRIEQLKKEFLRELNQEKGLAPEDKGLSFREAVHTKQLWTLLTIYFCFGFNAVAISLHVVPHATDLGISIFSAAAILSTIGGMSIAGRIVIGSVVDRIGYYGFEPHPECDKSHIQNLYLFL